MINAGSGKPEPIALVITQPHFKFLVAIINILFSFITENNPALLSMQDITDNSLNKPIRGQYVSQGEIWCPLAIGNYFLNLYKTGW